MSLLHDSFTSLRTTRRKARSQTSDKRFKELADKTGGKYFLVGDTKSALAPKPTELTPIFQAIEEDLKSQYLLGFYIAESSRDNRKHVFSVSMKPEGVEYSVGRMGYSRTHKFISICPQTKRSNLILTIRMTETSDLQLRPIRRALISVSDKTGIVDFARELANFNVEIISTGGTAKALRDAGIAVRDISDITGFPEMMDGRVKTLHPRVHGGLLAIRDNPEHVAAMEQHGIEPIDMVVVNLYPFAETIMRAGVTRDEAIEQIDIGGPAMIRSAAKNAQDVAVVVDPSTYDSIIYEMKSREGALSLATRKRLARALLVRLPFTTWL